VLCSPCPRQTALAQTIQTPYCEMMFALSLYKLADDVENSSPSLCPLSTSC